MNKSKVILISLLLLPFELMFSGFVFMKLWLWFIVPEFDVATLSFSAALSLSLFVSYATKSQSNSSDEELEKKFPKVRVLAFTKPALYLFLAWVVRFMF